MLWMKALHIIFVVCWFSGLFYLPRLLVNYAGASHDATREQLAQMARRLYRFVTPFMVLVILLGIGMLSTNPGYYLHAGWFWAKMAGMAFLVAYHFQCGRYVRAAVEGRDRHSTRYYRFFNEVPVLFLFAMVMLAVLKPF
ncbi:CopD family protein [Haliea sp. E17]|uniref:CopD family protein n=1 Tax=Haliea sp. E17 TaxID=3401576 RepID=UPI003AAAC73F